MEKAIADALREGGSPKPKTAVPECSEMLAFLSACGDIRPQIERIRRGLPVRHCGHYISDWTSCIWARNKSENINNPAKQQVRGSRQDSFSMRESRAGPLTTVETACFHTPT